MTKNTSTIKEFWRSHPLICNLILMALAVLVFVWICLFGIDLWTRHGSETIVPDIKLTTYQEASQRLADADLTIEIADSIYDRNLAPGTIVESWPKAGAVVKCGRPVYVTVNAFNAKMITLAMPVTGVSQRQAISSLNAAGITAVRIVEVPSQWDGMVERATYNGKPLQAGSIIPVTATVTLEVGVAYSYDDTEVETDSLGNPLPPRKFVNPTLSADDGEEY